MTSAESEFVDPKTIVVEDSWGDEDDFWNAFNLTSVAPTQVLPDSSLEVAVQVDGNWVVVQSFGSELAPRTVSLSPAEIAAAIGVGTDEVTGIRFTFTADDTYGAGTMVNPYFSSQARADLRDGSGAVTPGPEQPVVYTNTATTTGTGVTPGGETLTGNDVDTGQATVITYDNDGTGPGVGIGKSWNQPTVDSQSDQTRRTTLSWQVSPGFDTVTITDPAEPGAADSPEQTVFQAFDLTMVNPVQPSNVPFSNGWWLKYDTVTDVQLYNGSAWVSATNVPADGWNSNGAFTGYTLTNAERASTIGVRLILAENTAAREAAAQSGATTTRTRRARVPA